MPDALASACGIAALALLLLTGLYGVRRRLPGVSARLRAGTMRGWLGVHLAAGLAFPLLVALHAGLARSARETDPAGALGPWLALASAAAVLSGLVVVALERALPPLLAAAVADEVPPARAPERLAALRDEAARIVDASRSEPLHRIHARRVAPAFERRVLRGRELLAPRRAIEARLRELDRALRVTRGEEHEALRALRAVYRRKLEIDAQLALQRAMRLGVAAHLPLSLLLIVLVGAHVAAALAG
jgi:hypothetical protein